MFHKTGRLKARETARYVAIMDDGGRWYYELSPKGAVLPPAPPVARTSHPLPVPQITMSSPTPPPDPVSQHDRRHRRARGTCEFVGILDLDRLRPKSFPYSIQALLNPVPRAVVA
jgi:hypothetical protein